MKFFHQQTGSREENQPLVRRKCSSWNAFRFGLLLIVTLAPVQSHAFDLTLDIHEPGAYYNLPLSAFDYPPFTRVIIVTGTDNWPQENAPPLFNVRIVNAAGTPILSGITIHQGSPIGTVVGVYTRFNGEPQQFNVGTEIWGYPHHIETYSGQPNPYVGDARGDGWTITRTQSADGGNGQLVSAGGDQVWTVYAGPGPSPTPTPNPSPSPTSDKPNDRHEGGDGSDGDDENTSVEPAGGGDNHDCTHGMARYTADLLSASLRITDTPLEYTPPAGTKIDFIIEYRQRDADQSADQAYSHLSPNWTHNWMSYVTDNPLDPAAPVGIYVRGGGTELHSGYNATSQSFLPDPQSHAVLVRISSNSYEKRFPDGSKQVFGPAGNGASTYPRRLFMTQAVDAYNNIVRIQYLPGTTKIDRIIDAVNQETTFVYEDNDPYRITKVTDPFGRSVILGYTNNKLTSAEDPEHIVSQFTYQPGTNFINSLTTPYGTATFATGEFGTNRWLNMFDPTGAMERVEFRNNAPGISATDPTGSVPADSDFVNASLNVNNSFFWDKKALSMYPPVNGVYDYTKAKITHWLLSSDGAGPVPTVSSEKQPLEKRVWYTYLGQPHFTRIGATAQPKKVARVLGDGTTQISQFEYNTLGNITKTIDPVGRVSMTKYTSNGIDVEAVFQRRPNGQSTDPDGMAADKVRSFTYENTPHLPHTETDAAGQTTTFTYNSRGQVTERKNAKDERTTYAYGGTVPDGYLRSITGPDFNGSSAVTSFTYDLAHRVQTTTDSDSYELTFEYDNLDRKTKVTYFDGTFEQFTYTDNEHPTVMTLDVTGIRDRLGRWTYKHYNGNKQLDKVTDPLGRITLYGWCACGSLETIEDPNHNVTTFFRDIQGRVHQKRFADLTTINYLYEGQNGPNTAGATSRLKSSTDAKNQRTNYTYFKDDNIESITYTDLSGNPLTPPTPSVSYIYDCHYNRVKKMTDGIGDTDYDYYSVTAAPAPPTLGAGQLEAVHGPLGDDTITYTYDKLGRQTGRSINGVPNDITFDSLGRLDTTDNALGHFDRSYYGVTPRLHTLTYPNGQIADHTYFDNNHDRRLQTILNQAGIVTLSHFDYTYDAEGQVLTWGGTAHAALPLPYIPLVHDNAKQLSVDFHGSIVGEGDFGFAYEYDDAGNRTRNSAFFPQGNYTTGSTYTVNNLNQLTSVTRDTGNGSPVTTPLTHDAAGNMTYDGDKQTFEWDAANRLIAINYTDSGNRTEFAYDGQGRRVKITEFGAAVSAEVQPKGEEFTPYSTKEFNLITGEYALMFEGLNPNGGNNSALIDGVMLNESLVPGGGFENPVLSADTVAPSNGGWNFAGSAGVAAHGGDLMTGGPGAPEGDQAGFVTNTGALWQFGTVPPGVYTLNFQAAQAVSGNDSNQRVGVTLRGALSTKWLVWSGNTIAEERDATGGTVTKRFFAEGQQQIGGKNEGNYYYSRDHLGSIRELTDASGNLVAQYDYDSWGKPVVLSGNMTVDFGFTGHYFHQPSGLNLAMHRAYNPTLGRWISRDPLGEEGGLNLYGYVLNNPIKAIDPLGLAPGDWWDLRTPRYLADQASLYAENFRGKNGNDSDHHSIAVRNFGERMEAVYGTSVVGSLSAFWGAVLGNWAELSAPSEDWAEDIDANLRGFWDYLYETPDRSEPLNNPCP